MELSLIEHFLPKDLLLHFSITAVNSLCNVKDKTEYISINLEENNKILCLSETSEYESKGFTEITLQDFPIRGKAVFLVIKRRRWRHKHYPNKTIRNDFSFVAEGSVLTKELSDFLKGTGRYKS